jgi:hypothetical protein
MASIRKQKSGAWRVQVRRKGRSLSEVFIRFEDAKRWAVDAERQIDRGETPSSSRLARVQTFGHLVDLHTEDMCAVGQAPRRSKAATLRALKRDLGSCNMVSLDRDRLVRFGRERAADVRIGLERLDFPGKLKSGHRERHASQRGRSAAVLAMRPAAGEVSQVEGRPFPLTLRMGVALPSGHD